MGVLLLQNASIIIEYLTRSQHQQRATAATRSTALDAPRGGVLAAELQLWQHTQHDLGRDVDQTAVLDVSADRAASPSESATR